MKLTVIVRKGEEQYVALCPELDVVSQGHTIEQALANFKEAIELHIEVMGYPEAVNGDELIITSIEVKGDRQAPEIVR